MPSPCRCDPLLLLVVLPPCASIGWCFLPLPSSGGAAVPFRMMKGRENEIPPPPRVTVVRSSSSSFSRGSPPPSPYCGGLPSLPFSGGSHSTSSAFPVGTKPLLLPLVVVRPTPLGRSPRPAFGWGVGSGVGVLGGWVVGGFGLDGMDRMASLSLQGQENLLLSQI